jgi:hypothetical protein
MSDLTVMATCTAGLVVIDDQAPSWSCQFTYLTEQNAFACLCRTVAVTIRLKPIVRVHE